MDKEVISKDEAERLGLSKFFTGVPCNHGHVCHRYIRGGACVKCVTSRTKWRAEERRNPALRRERLEYLAIIASDKKQEKPRPKKRKIKAKQPRKKEAGVTSAKDLMRLARHAAVFAKYRASKKGAVPSWVNHKHLLTIYANRPSDCHVDHIFPLAGVGYCGLHVPWNLQFIPAGDNLRKSNKIPDANALAWPDGHSSRIYRISLDRYANSLLGRCMINLGDKSMPAPEIHVSGKHAILMGALDLEEGDCVEVPVRIVVKRHTKTTEAGKTSYSMTWCVTGIGEWEECESEDSDEDAAEYPDDVANLRATLDLDE